MLTITPPIEETVTVRAMSRDLLASLAPQGIAYIRNEFTRLGRTVSLTQAQTSLCLTGNVDGIDVYTRTPRPGLLVVIRLEIPR
jgi:hypothetical protein